MLGERFGARLGDRDRDLEEEDERDEDLDLGDLDLGDLDLEREEGLRRRRLPLLPDERLELRLRPRAGRRGGDLPPCVNQVQHAGQSL